MAGRIAVLVLAHQPAALQCLMDLLDDRFAIFVHVDAKTDLAGARLRPPPHATVLTERHEVFWGGWSMMLATMALIEAACRRGDFRRLVLISGDSLPVVPLDVLEAALLDETREFIELIEVADDPSLAGSDMAEAFARHGWSQPWRLHNPVHWDHRLLNPFQRRAAAVHYGVEQSRIDWIRGDVERLVQALLRDLHPARPQGRFRSFWYGSQWWGLGGQTIAAILPELRDPATQAFFRYMQVPDEHMVQTLLGNQQQALAGRVAVGSPVFIDLERRARGIDALDARGFRGAAAHGAQILFARKFNPRESPMIADAIRGGRYQRDVLATAGPGG